MQFSTLFESILDWVAGFSGVWRSADRTTAKCTNARYFPSAGQACFVRWGFSLIEGASAFDQTSG
jgi:hypothetical protein